MNILVTGAAGFIGSHLAERLAGLNHSVTGLDCLINNYSESLKKLNLNQLQKKGIKFFNIDLSQDDLEAITGDNDFIFHLAAQPGIDASVPFDSYERNNIIATHRLLEAIIDSKSLQGFVNISTSSVYGSTAINDESSAPKPISVYGVTKLAAEQLVLAESRNENITACSLRLFSVYGPRERPEKLYHKLIKCILNDEDFPLCQGSENHIRSYTYIDDIIDGIVTVMDNIEVCNGEIFNIGSDEAITTGEGIKIVEEIIGKKARIKIEPKRPGDQLKTHANINKARKVLGYNPTTKPEDGLKKEVGWFKANLLGKNY
ncbi:MAG: NAD-dependent epimerase/dehydratase family protein [Planctomycetia bacterium]|nr:NAD-dependent epimerase/dehydratase family protein [Planctomycetia bacterium]